MKGSGKLRLWSLVFLFAMLFACASEAAVTLTPRVQRGTIVGDESYVYFGSFKHRLNTWDGVKEITATPVLWRVMSVDFSVNPTKATLLSHFLVDAMEYGTWSQNTWSGSHVQTWLNGTFLSDFSAEEKADSVMMTPSPDGITGTQVTLPSGSADRSSGTSKTWPYEDADIKAWFGDNDYDGTRTNTNARKTHFKGAHPASYEYGNTDKGWDYWTRSPFPDYNFAVWYVFGDGGLSTLVYYYPVGVRPVFFLNLESFLFKSASVFGHFPDAGSKDNPYFVYLSTEEVQPVEPNIEWTTAFGRELTVRFTTTGWHNGAAFHAYNGTEPDETGPDGLIKNFSVTDSTVTKAVVSGDGVILTLDAPVDPDNLPTIAYDPISTTDGLGFVPDTLVPTTMAGFTAGPATIAKPWLSALTFTPDITLSPAFDPNTFSYTASVPNDVSSLTVTPTPVPAGAHTEIVPASPVALNVGDNTITITVQQGEATTEYTVRVNRPPVPVTGVTLNKKTLSLEAGRSETLTATVAPANATNQAATWASDRPDVATVAGGTVTAVGPGDCTITVATVDGGFQDTCTVTVAAPVVPIVPVTGVTLNKDNLSLIVGRSETLSATVAPANATNKTVTWASDKPDVVTVEGGKVTAVAPGNCTITATTADGNKTATCAVTVTPVPVDGVTLDRTTLVLKKGDTFRLTATVSPDDAGNKNVTWTSSNPNFATVDATGKVTGVAANTVAITVTTEDGGKTAVCMVTVTVTEIVVDLSDLDLARGILNLKPGDAVDVTLGGTPEGLKFDATGLPPGLTLTEDGHLYGRVPEVGAWPIAVTVTAPDGTEKTVEFVVRVQEDRIVVEDTDGGCNAGFGLLALALFLLKRR